ncbi:MAG: YbhB/YbcL family Raf kinase inhibitor-like protein [Actinomycetota bacterium]|nr:YbhB/YbcL family Raf kinase inhibitor-like protein [Actinomycetota bacterium]
MSRVVLSTLLVISLGACGSDEPEFPEGPDLGFTSPDVAGGEVVPDVTCADSGVSPELRWEGVDRADEYAVTVTDPDAPGGTFVHWVIWGIPASESELVSDVGPDEFVQGTNDYDEEGYGEICPPEGETHTYVFKLFALDGHPTEDLGQGASHEDFLGAVECCVLAVDEFTGKYTGVE